MIRFVNPLPDGSSTTLQVDARPGQSVMQAAVAAGVGGIAADCGGMMTCATCHVYVAPDWIGKLPAPGGEELGMLDFTAAERRPGSRLSCQIEVAPDYEGLTLELPEQQY